MADTMILEYSFFGFSTFLFFSFSSSFSSFSISLTMSSPLVLN
nr:MAG TPA: hypothetical protein [Caudoviricetes sp.]